MSEKSPSDKIFLGTWCTKMENEVRNFFSYHYKNGLTKTPGFPLYLQEAEWQSLFITYLNQRQEKQNDN